MRGGGFLGRLGGDDEQREGMRKLADRFARAPA
jgi:hypothetical protein